MSSPYAAFADLSDDQLLAEVTRLAARERRATAELVASLVVLDARRLYLREGYPSLFAYCTGALHLAEGAAYLRIEAARAVRRFPVLLERLASGAITLTGIKLLAPHLTETNHLAVLDAARGQSKRETEHLVAHLQPRPDVPAVIRKLSVRQVACDPRGSRRRRRRPPTTFAFAPATALAHTTALAPATALPRATALAPAIGWAPVTALATPSAEAAAANDQAQEGGAAGVSSALAFDAPAIASLDLPPPRPAVLVPLAPERYKVQMTIGAETYDRLCRAQALLRHTIPDGDLAAIFDQALLLLLERLERQKWGARKARREWAKSDAANRAPGSAEAQEEGSPAPEGDRTDPASASAAARWRRRRERPQPRPTAAGSEPGCGAPPAVAKSVAVELVPERVPAGDGRTVETRPDEALGPRKTARAASRRIPAAVRRAVWQRANGQCTYVSPSGQRCQARSRLEFHHAVPYADGGRADIEGIRLLCVAHHARETERWFGERLARGPHPATP